MVGRVGIEPTVFLMCLIYNQVSSPTGRTDPYKAEGRKSFSKMAKTLHAILFLPLSFGILSSFIC